DEACGTSDTRVCILTLGSSRGVRGTWQGQTPLIFMRFHAVPLGNQHKIWSKQHNGKVRVLPPCGCGNGSSRARKPRCPQGLDLPYLKWRAVDKTLLHHRIVQITVSIMKRLPSIREPWLTHYRTSRCLYVSTSLEQLPSLDSDQVEILCA